MARNHLAGIAMGLLLAAPTAGSQTPPADWTEPFPGHRVIGNLYAVGTAGLGVFLVTSDEGHILINTGLEDSTPLIRENIESLGYRLEDVRILLTMQAHWDHVAALAEIRELTGAEMWATAGDGRVLEDGGFSDPHFGGRVSFPPVEVDRIISDGEVIKLGDIRLRVHEHPGHTEGSSSSLCRRHGRPGGLPCHLRRRPHPDQHRPGGFHAAHTREHRVAGLSPGRCEDPVDHAGALGPRGCAG